MRAFGGGEGADRPSTRASLGQGRVCPEYARRLLRLADRVAAVQKAEKPARVPTNGRQTLYLAGASQPDAQTRCSRTATRTRAKLPLRMGLLMWCVLAVGLVGAHCGRWQPKAPRHGFQGKSSSDSDPTYTEEEAVKFYEDYDAQAALFLTKETLALWAYDSNITDHNLQQKLAASAETAKFTKESWSKLIKFPWKDFKDPELRRKFKLSSVLGNAALSEEDYNKLQSIVGEMSAIYSKAKICSYQDKNKCDLSLEPELTELLMKSRDPEELRHIWIEWRRNSGEKVKEQYKEYVALSNKAARMNNFDNAAALWLNNYESDEFRGQIGELWHQLKPLYQQLHAYVRRHLRIKYGDEVVKAKGPIPAHLLGNMWSQTWGNIADFMLPYPDRQSTDVTPNMIKQGYTAERMFKLSEEFFTSLNLSAMPEMFWDKSILEKPTDGRELVCHASAWDFYDRKDFRIKQCTRINQEDLYTAHHEMGHVQYFLQYKHQPIVFRTGANDGFHEAIGDVMSLSVSTPKHLRTIGLLEEESTEMDKKASYEATINYLFTTALDKIAFLPFAYELDLWRWDVFEGKTTPENYNCHFWKLAHEFQGIEPPVDRTEEDFDIASKYHIVADVPYIRYFISFVIQFQFHKGLCQAAGQLENNAPLHECDIYKSATAGNLLGSMLQLGASKPWPDAMEVVTGQRKMDASALREYFAPLEEWLRAENEKTGEFIGWDKTDKYCVQTRDELRKLVERE
ncbi:angiotensin-converting enzyme-like isoform X1 [Cloeon dipterum]|uniref:angiotensin-converting enzyme-like isoform X1 n=1 Tax=Cloeon dipterum TaxID=197152 RepID=UPI0032206ECA